MQFGSDIVTQIRKVILWITSLVVVAGILEGLLQKNIQKLAEQKGWDKMLANSWHPSLNKALEIVTSPYRSYVFWFCLGIAIALWATRLFPSRPARIANSQSPTLTAGLYVGEIRISLEKIADDRHSEITIRVFNGTGKTVQFARLSGQIKFTAPGSAHSGVLPSPTIRADMSNTVQPLVEWLMILDQRVPSEEAAKLSDILNDNRVIHFDLSGLKIEVSAEGVKGVQSLNLWYGLTARTGVAWGRIVALAAHLGE
jgi:hypothetical protein